MLSKFSQNEILHKYEYLLYRIKLYTVNTQDNYLKLTWTLHVALIK